MSNLVYKIKEAYQQGGIIEIFRKAYLKTLPVRLKIKWKFMHKKYLKEIVKDSEITDDSIIISLTSFPQRVESVIYTLHSLIMQNYKFDKIVLWLTFEEFPNQIDDLPEGLTKLTQYGVEIKWCHNIRSYNKLVPSLREYPNSVIVTADDDILYSPSWLKKLVESYRKDPNFVHCHRITKIIINNDKYDSIVGGYETYGQPCFLHYITGVGGVLYPPKSLHEDVLKEDVFLKLARTNDDTWFWIMAIRNNVKIKVVEKNIPELIYVKHTQEGRCLNTENDKGLFWKDFDNLLNEYPEVDEILKKELSSME